MRILTEDSQLYKGIFWIKDVNDISDSNLFFQVPCNCEGSVESNLIDTSYASKSGDSFNHKNTWSQLSSRETDNKPFDYYPRGRVEIANGKATIYANPNICTGELEKWCVSRYNLNTHNGIKKVRIIPDYSSHYKCYLDK